MRKNDAVFDLALDGSAQDGPGVEGQTLREGKISTKEPLFVQQCGVGNEKCRRKRILMVFVALLRVSLLIYAAQKRRSARATAQFPMRGLCFRCGSLRGCCE
ncbi:hypothetical protein CEXT_215961 [Caerostris extrusa]|uniref:Uncharacterized protein n=1 Tax=Caerostris extrusa TaxID=172846 RepID=A0AAV4STT1_CAEEX|nr:hypothetical protein CEXT_215961 [Caerostris extrusa]